MATTCRPGMQATASDLPCWRLAARVRLRGMNGPRRQLWPRGAAATRAPAITRCPQIVPTPARVSGIPNTGRRRSNLAARASNIPATTTRSGARTHFRGDRRIRVPTPASLRTPTNAQRDRVPTIVWRRPRRPCRKTSAGRAQIIVRRPISPRGARTPKSGHRRPQCRRASTPRLNATVLRLRRCRRVNQRRRRASARHRSGTILHPHRVPHRLPRTPRHLLLQPRLPPVPITTPNRTAATGSSPGFAESRLEGTGFPDRAVS